MYKIRLIWVGKTQELYIREGVNDYLNRLKPYVNIECLQVKPASSKSGIDDSKRKETYSILKCLSDGETNFVLDEHGPQKTSVQFASLLENLKNTQYKRVNFIIGGAFGMDLSLMEKFKQLSLSSMTFTHQMVRLVLAEQIYRAFTIINGKGYHH